MKTIVKQDSLKAWILAARPKTLTAAIIPVMIGTSLAVLDGGFQAVPAAICCLFAAMMQIASNFINDLYDFLKGTDREDRLGPERACAQGWISPRAMRIGIATILALACLTGCILISYGGWGLILLGVTCVAFAFLYTTCLSYNGWGDALVVVFFGFVPVGGTYYVQTLEWTPEVLLCALACGLAIDTLLVVNNYRDREADTRSGKQTLIVRMGEKFGRWFYLILGLAAVSLCLCVFAVQERWPAALLPVLYLLPHYHSWRQMVRIAKGKELNKILGQTSRNMLLFGLLLSIGLLLSK